MIVFSNIFYSPLQGRYYVYDGVVFEEEEKSKIIKTMKEKPASAAHGSGNIPGLEHFSPRQC